MIGKENKIRENKMKQLSISSIIQLVLLSIVISLFFACSSSTNKKAVEDAMQDYWSIPEQYKNISLEQIKAQVEIIEYKTIKGAATRAEKDMVDTLKTTTMKADEEALATFVNKLVTLEGEIDFVGRQAKAPLSIEEPEPGKYQMWFCDKTRKPCRYAMFLLLEGAEGKGNTFFAKDTRIRFWGVIIDEEIRRMMGESNYPNYKRYPKVRVLHFEIIK